MPMNVSILPGKGRLADLRVLVTRPVHQAQRLCELIKSEGGEAILFPVLEIVEPADPSPLLAIIERLDDFEIAIFISSNAVEQALGVILAQRTLPAHLKLAVIGVSSAKKLEQFGLSADICPSEKFNSEALLSLPEMHAVAGKSIIIFRGEGGREFLADTLKQRGAEVEYATVYQRTKPQTEPGILLRALQRSEFDMISVTSNEALHNLFDMAGSQGRELLHSIPLAVLSERTAALAEQLGYTHPPCVSNEASDEGLIEALVQLARKGVKKRNE
jgi:uroporphyrinogen-III synthase